MSISAASWLNIGSTSPRVTAMIIDGHVIWPCGCAWNQKYKSYTKNCSAYSGRTTTPPHPSEEFLDVERRYFASKQRPGRHRPASTSRLSLARRIGSIRLGRATIKIDADSAGRVLRDVSRSGDSEVRS